MTETTISPQQSMAAIRSQGGRFFRIKFARRNDGKNGERAGEARSMLCRLHVRRHVGGKMRPNERALDDMACGCITVWDVEVFWREYNDERRLGATRADAHIVAGKKAYRRIPLDSVLELPRRVKGSEIPTK